jgi:hypothetical protein
MIRSEYTGEFVAAVAPIDLEIERAIGEAAEAAAPLFAANNWTWSREGGLVVPDAEMIADNLRGLVRSIYRDSLERIACGRLMVDRVVDEDGGGTLGFFLELGEAWEEVTR